LFTLNPSEDTEVYFICVRIEAYDTDSEGNLVTLRVYDETDNVYYPFSGGVSAIIALKPSVLFYFTVPKNVNGHTLKIQAQANLSGTKISGCRYAWGHSPHYHR